MIVQPCGDLANTEERNVKTGLHSNYSDTFQKNLCEGHLAFPKSVISKAKVLLKNYVRTLGTVLLYLIKLTIRHII